MQQARGVLGLEVGGTKVWFQASTHFKFDSMHDIELPSKVKLKRECGVAVNLRCVRCCCPLPLCVVGFRAFGRGC